MKKYILKLLYKIYAVFARIYLRRHEICIVWVTWSVWKTWSRMIISQILKKYLPNKKIYTSSKNFNSELWLVLSIFWISEYTPSSWTMFKLIFIFFYKSLFSEKIADILILEYGIDSPWDMDHLLNIAKPDIWVFTQLDYIHSANFESKQALWEEKAKLLKNTKKTSFLNYKDDFQHAIEKEVSSNIVFYNKNDIFYKYSFSENKVLTSLNFWNFNLETNILWEDSFIYIELWFLILEEILTEKLQVKDEILEFDRIWWRFSLFFWKHDSIIIDSSYNAWEKSMQQMIVNTLRIQEDLYPNHKVLFVLGDMREVWEESERLHENLFEYTKFKWWIVSVWKETWKYFKKHLWNFQKSTDAGKFIENYIWSQEDKFVILFKWSQNTIFLEEAIKEILLDKSDEKKLIRQEEYRMKIKKNFFKL